MLHPYRDRMRTYIHTHMYVEHLLLCSRLLQSLFVYVLYVTFMYTLCTCLRTLLDLTYLSYNIDMRNTITAVQLRWK